MDILDDELLKFWRSLNSHQVRYIMVGGFATRFHGFNRTTEDLDVWLDDTPQNRKNLRKSFIDLDYGNFPSLETMEFLTGWTSFYVGNAIELDIMTKMRGWRIILLMSVSKWHPLLIWMEFLCLFCI